MEIEANRARVAEVVQLSAGEAERSADARACTAIRRQRLRGRIGRRLSGQPGAAQISLTDDAATLIAADAGSVRQGRTVVARSAAVGHIAAEVDAGRADERLALVAARPSAELSRSSRTITSDGPARGRGDDGAEEARRVCTWRGLWWRRCGARRSRSSRWMSPRPSSTPLCRRRCSARTRPST